MGQRRRHAPWWNRLCPLGERRLGPATPLRNATCHSAARRTILEAREGSRTEIRAPTGWMRDSSKVPQILKGTARAGSKSTPGSLKNYQCQGDTRTSYIRIVQVGPQHPSWHVLPGFEFHLRV